MIRPPPRKATKIHKTANAGRAYSATACASAHNLGDGDDFGVLCLKLAVDGYKMRVALACHTALEAVYNSAE